MLSAAEKKEIRQKINSNTVAFLIGEEEEIVVPITGDNINLYIALAAISLMILIILAIYGKKNINKSLLVLVVLLPLIVKGLLTSIPLGKSLSLEK